MIDLNMCTVVAKDYHFAPKNGVTDVVLLEVANKYEQQIMRKISFIFPDQLNQKFSGTGKVHVSTKYDGEGVFVYFEKNKFCFCFSPSSGRMRLGFKALQDLSNLLGTKVNKALFRAELYLVGGTAGTRETVSDVIRVSFANNSDDHDRLALAIFDIIMLDGDDYQNKTIEEIWLKLDTLFDQKTELQVNKAKYQYVEEKMVHSLFENEVASGNEGIVVRALNSGELFKIKPRRTIDAVVIGYVYGELENGTGITSLLTALNYNSQDKLLLQTLVRVGSGFTDDQRVSLLAVFESRKVKAPMLMTDSDGRAVHFVKPEVIVEVLCEDIIETSASNKVNNTQLFSFQDGEYTFEGLSSCPRPLFATFLKIRDDKTLSSGGARIAQISSASAPQIKKSGNNKPEILNREVYVKGEMVRKLLVVKNQNDSVPYPYLIYWTDYSAKRKEPLKVEFKLASDHERLEQICKLLREENIVKGWERFN